MNPADLYEGRLGAGNGVRRAPVRPLLRITLAPPGSGLPAVMLTLLFRLAQALGVFRF